MSRATSMPTNIAGLARISAEFGTKSWSEVTAPAIALARDTDLIASVPERYITVPPRGLYCFELPVTLPPFTVAMLWHPRQDADLAHRWLRACLREVCGP